ncbi:MAG: TetR/AcrR family transcriptional regulator [Planctomycetota bacterium]
MPRPDLTTERTEQILDAFERCIARDGLAGTSLADIAEEAGVKRSLLRHYVGNRDDLVHALGDRLVEEYRAELQEMAEYVAGGERVERLLHSLFPPPSDEAFRRVLVIEALIAASREDETLRAQMVATVEDLVAAVVDALRAEFPDAAKKDVFSVSWGIVGLSFNEESVTPLELAKRYRRGSMEAARRLIGSLE